jgi:hypothetical protein
VKQTLATNGDEIALCKRGGDHTRDENGGIEDQVALLERARLSALVVYDQWLSRQLSGAGGLKPDLP